jgi:hypothetical protein
MFFHKRIPRLALRKMCRALVIRCNLLCPVLRHPDEYPNQSAVSEIVVLLDTTIHSRQGLYKVACRLYHIYILFLLYKVQPAMFNFHEDR